MTVYITNTPLRKTLYLSILWQDPTTMRLQSHVMDQVSQAVALPPPATFPMFPSSHLVILFTQILVAIPTWQLLLARGTVGCFTYKIQSGQEQKSGQEWDSWPQYSEVNYQTASSRMSLHNPSYNKDYTTHIKEVLYTPSFITPLLYNLA